MQRWGQLKNLVQLIVPRNIGRLRLAEKITMVLGDEKEIERGKILAAWMLYYCPIRHGGRCRIDAIILWLED